MPSSMEIEIRKVTGVAQKSSESRQAYLTRVYEKVRDLSDDDWEKLTPQAQQWFNEAGGAWDDTDKPDLPDFPVAPKQQTDEDRDQKEREDTMATAPKKKAATAAKKTRTKKVANGNGTVLRDSGAAVLKRALLRNPKLADKELAKICKDKGFKLSPFSIAARKQDFLHTIKVLQADGRLKD